MTKFALAITALSFLALSGSANAQLRGGGGFGDLFGSGGSLADLGDRLTVIIENAFDEEADTSIEDVIDDIKEELTEDVLNDIKDEFMDAFTQDLVGLECAAVANEPECTNLLTGEPGDWLCRSVYNVFTGDPEKWSTCGNSALALPNDECGCCEGGCPTPCECGCELEDGSGEGVRVTLKIPFSDEEEEECMPADKAISVIAKPGEFFQCVQDCAAAAP